MADEIHRRRALQSLLDRAYPAFDVGRDRRAFSGRPSTSPNIAMSVSSVSIPDGPAAQDSESSSVRIPLASSVFRPPPVVSSKALT
ncbi:hypothetical protein [Saccharopolyspora hattusasensis]|uniref:hypothetical protein n=1 Tax=Saccharopolyspora hattusasensis TaxID=1128679 RepID=UPI003D966888